MKYNLKKPLFYSIKLIYRFLLVFGVGLFMLGLYVHFGGHIGYPTPPAFVPLYAKKIEVQAIMGLKEQALQAKENPKKKLLQLTRSDLLDKEIYLILKLRNRGNKSITGTIFITGTFLGKEYKIDIESLDPQERSVYVLPAHKIPLSTQYPKYTPQVGVFWKNLFVKPKQSHKNSPVLGKIENALFSV